MVSFLLPKRGTELYDEKEVPVLCCPRTSSFHFKTLSVGLRRVRYYMKGWKHEFSLSLIIFFLNLMMLGSMMNLGSMALQETILVSDSFLMKF